MGRSEFSLYRHLPLPRLWCERKANAFTFISLAASLYSPLPCRMNTLKNRFPTRGQCSHRLKDGRGGAAPRPCHETVREPPHLNLHSCNKIFRKALGSQPFYIRHRLSFLYIFFSYQQIRYTSMIYFVLH